MKTVATGKRSAVLNYFSLFTSLSTLMCCALPSLLVLFGLGTSVASMLSFMPWLVTLSRHKQWTFGRTDCAELREHVLHRAPNSREGMRRGRPVRV